MFERVDFVDANLFAQRVGFCACCGQTEFGKCAEAVLVPAAVQLVAKGPVGCVWAGDVEPEVPAIIVGVAGGACPLSRV